MEVFFVSPSTSYRKKMLLFWTAPSTSRDYLGHYNPTGNQFQAFTIKDKLVAMLDPKPVAYRE
jgi:hypothetical protein